MNPTEAIPLLVVVLLLVSAGGEDIGEMAIVFEGAHEPETVDDVHVVAGGTTTVPTNGSVSGDVYVIGGTVRVAGELDGDVTVLAGNVSVLDGGAVTGTLRTISGDTSVEEGATVGVRSSFDPPAPNDSPVRRVGGFLARFLLLAGVGWALARRSPGLLANVGHAVTDHPLVSGVTGALAAVTLLVLFVYMAFTILLIPVSVAGLVAELVVVLYGQVALGYLVGRRLPIDRPEVATVAGVGLFLLGVEILGLVPYVGPALQLGLFVVGFGAVVNTYFGLQRFEPAAVPGAVDL
ncbi:bactofilin family protein [Halosimplex sp. J119]